MFQFRDFECGCVAASTTAQGGLPVMFIVRNCQNHPNEQPQYTSEAIIPHDLVIFLYFTVTFVLVFVATYYIFYYNYEVPDVEAT